MAVLGGFATNVSPQPLQRIFFPTMLSGALIAFSHSGQMIVIVSAMRGTCCAATGTFAIEPSYSYDRAIGLSSWGQVSNLPSSHRGRASWKLAPRGEQREEPMSSPEQR